MSMTNLSSHRRMNTFRLSGDNSSIYCDVKVEIDHKKYNNNDEYYNIIYTYTYSDETDEARDCNPLYNNHNHVDGEVLFVNDLSTTLCHYLLMDLSELSNYIGDTNPEYYKGSIMNMISYLGD